MKNSFESINSPKFEAFKGSAITNLMAITGGARVRMSSGPNGAYDDAETTGILGTSTGDYKSGSTKWHSPLIGAGGGDGGMELGPVELMP